MTREYGILVDIETCIGCGVCVISCKQENNLPPYTDDEPGTTGIAWNQVLSIAEGKYPKISEFHIPAHCMQCKNPPCVPSCPEAAIAKNQNGILVVDQEKCNGCANESDQLKKCLSACPYEAVQFNPEKQVAQTCTLCVQRVESGVQPACVSDCVGRCLTFGDFADPESDISKKAVAAGDRLFCFLEEKGTRPSVKYINPEKPHPARVDKISPFTRVKSVYGYGSDHNKPAE